MVQAVFHDGKHVFIAAAFDKKKLIGPKPRLLQARRIQIKTRHRPEHTAILGRKARADAGREKRSGSKLSKLR